MAEHVIVDDALHLRLVRASGRCETVIAPHGAGADQAAERRDERQGISGHRFLYFFGLSSMSFCAAIAMSCARIQSDVLAGILASA
jgi:hypothetical protein